MTKLRMSTPLTLVPLILMLSGAAASQYKILHEFTKAAGPAAFSAMLPSGSLLRQDS
jgi:hypothetical protein